jgi:glucosamine--fructose-6-phosphate aminotransferase (isomerizing)
MAVEAGSAGTVLRRQFDANRELVRALAGRLAAHPPRMVITCARGSSDHAATFAKYLIEQELGLPVLSFSPSLASLHGKGLGGPDTLFLAISQSGGSPDILTATQRARECGALTVALVNVEASPLAKAADCVVALHAGAETSVAATKSFIASLGALLQLVAVLRTREDWLHELPPALERSWALPWDRPAHELAQVGNLFVIGRGLGLGVAQELALKFKETCQIHAEAFSGAEVRHGPMSLVGKNFPVIILSQPDESRTGLLALAEEFVGRGARVYASGIEAQGLRALPDCGAAPLTAPLLAIQGFYKLVNAVALARGLDPDRPPYLAKVTRTL